MGVVAVICDMREVELTPASQSDILSTPPTIRPLRTTLLTLRLPSRVVCPGTAWSDPSALLLNGVAVAPPSDPAAR